MTTTTDPPAPSALEVGGGGGASRRWWWFGGMSACLLVGFAVVALVGSYAIEAAYHGDGFTFLRPLMPGRDARPVEYYKARLFRLGLTAVGVGIVATAMALVSTSGWFFRRFVGEARPGALALIRILACAVLLTDVVTIDLGQVAMFPPDVRLRMGVLHVLQQLPLGLDALNASAAGLRIWQALTALWLLLGLLGWHTRFALPLALVFYVVVGGILRQYDRPGHGSLAAMYVLAILCFTPCGDAWSLDRWRRRRRGLPVAPLELPQPIYGWARYLCWIPIVLIYVEAGLTKIVHGGLYWWIAPNLRSMMLRGSIEDVEQRWTLVPEIVAAPDAVFAAVGIVTVAGEVLFFLVLFSVTARRILPLVMLGMHLGILVILRLRFLDMMLFTLIFYDWSAVGAWLRRRFDALSSESNPLPADTVAGADPATYPPGRGRLAFPLAACAIVLVMLGVWARQIEFYPLSSMHMFASFNGTSVVPHYKVIAHYVSGGVGRVYPEELLPVVGRIGYRQSLRRALVSPDHPHARSDRRIARGYLQTLGRAWNRSHPDQAIARIEVQEWRWDYRAHPDDRDFGELATRFEVTIAEPATSISR